MLSAIADIQNATRETASLQALALIQYEDKKLADAFKFTQSAIDDVVSSGIHFRAMEIYKFYSIINSAYQTEQARSRENLVTFLISTSIILFLLVLLVICIYFQMRKILRIKRALAQSNEKLLKLNEKLNAMNSQLNDTNSQLCEISNVKEHYIAEFFDVCFSYISKMEKYQNVLYKYAINRYYEELIKKLKSSTLIDEELSALYARFDKVFLGLYPTFVSDFNALLKDEEQIVLKPDALLNRELRIYALLRLGITDSGKIANFLRCSTSTVYNYRTRMRNKAAVDRDAFENEIMKISSTQEK
jgi:DNA-binding CsgD family transcriptional regulator/cell division protein FtsB